MFNLSIFRKTAFIALAVMISFASVPLTTHANSTDKYYATSYNHKPFEDRLVIAFKGMTEKKYIKQFIALQKDIEAMHTDYKGVFNLSGYNTTFRLFYRLAKCHEDPATFCPAPKKNIY